MQPSLHALHYEKTPPHSAAKPVIFMQRRRWDTGRKKKALWLTHKINAPRHHAKVVRSEFFPKKKLPTLPKTIAIERRAAHSTPSWLKWDIYQQLQFGNTNSRFSRPPTNTPSWELPHLAVPATNLRMVWRGTRAPFSTAKSQAWSQMVVQKILFHYYCEKRERRKGSI